MLMVRRSLLGCDTFRPSCRLPPAPFCHQSRCIVHKRTYCKDT
uniref:Uncharacterized protein n=1 Tax=Anguilla anguilla TaxID=7936 RepID=A0A0E9SEI6_ANGAN